MLQNRVWFLWCLVYKWDIPFLYYSRLIKAKAFSNRFELKNACFVNVRKKRNKTNLLKQFYVFNLIFPIGCDVSIFFRR